MNLFYLDRNISRAVYYHCDKHIVKMCLETAQILCTSLRRHGLSAPYRSTHEKHPTVLWAGDSIQHYRWVRRFGLALCTEYTWRYKKQHASEIVIKSLPTTPPLLDIGWCDPPQAMPDNFKHNDVVKAYRCFYRAEKSKFANWTKRPVPHFMQATLLDN